MKLEWMNDPQQMNAVAARIVSDLLIEKPDATIALPTGNTPLGLYRTLVALNRAGKFSCSEARFFNLDEFGGKSPDDPQSYGAFLNKHVFEPLAVDEGRIACSAAMPRIYVLNARHLRPRSNRAEGSTWQFSG